MKPPRDRTLRVSYGGPDLRPDRAGTDGSPRPKPRSKGIVETDIERCHPSHDLPLPERISGSPRGQMASGSEREPFAESTLRGSGLEFYRVRTMGRPASHSPCATPTAAHKVEYDGSRFLRDGLRDEAGRSFRTRRSSRRTTLRALPGTPSLPRRIRRQPPGRPRVFAGRRERPLWNP